MLAELVDAVVGVDTHRDTHEVEIALPTGTPIGTRRVVSIPSSLHASPSLRARRPYAQVGDRTTVMGSSRTPALYSRDGDTRSSPVVTPEAPS